MWQPLWAPMTIASCHTAAILGPVVALNPVPQYTIARMATTGNCQSGTRVAKICCVLSLHLASVTILVLFGSLKITVLPNTSTKHRSLAPYLSLECEHLDLGFKTLTGIKSWKPPVLKRKQTLFMKFLIWAWTHAFQKKRSGFTQ